MVCTSLLLFVYHSSMSLIQKGLVYSCPISIPGKAAAQSSPNFTNSSMLNECSTPVRLLKMHPVLQHLCTQFHICTSQARTSLDSQKGLMSFRQYVSKCDLGNKIKQPTTCTHVFLFLEIKFQNIFTHVNMLNFIKPPTCFGPHRTILREYVKPC